MNFEFLTILNSHRKKNDKNQSFFKKSFTILCKNAPYSRMMLFFMFENREKISSLLAIGKNITVKKIREAGAANICI